LKNADSIVVRDAELRTPGSQQLILENFSLCLGEGDRVLVVGPSGCGKTSLLRMLSGLWEPYKGYVEKPSVGQLLFVPQKPYMLLGSLRDQLCYPRDEAAFSDEQLQGALRTANLENFIERYPDFRVKLDWPRLLSLGEQQRLAFARLLLNSPKFVVLDEATSALDVKTERKLYASLVERNISFVSVGHRPTLTAFHNTVLELHGDGKWTQLPADTYTFSNV